MRARPCVRQLAGIEISSSVRRGMRNVYDAAPAGEKANTKQKKDAEEEIKGSRSASTCDVDSSRNPEGGARSNPRNCLQTQKQRQMSGDGFIQVNTKSKDVQTGD